MAKKQDTLKRMWIFTLNNYSEENVKHIKQYFNDDRCTYAIVGKEIGESGTPHLQGYVHLKKAVRFTALKKVLPKAHWEAARGSDTDNQKYCSKDGDVILEIGTPAARRKGGILKLVPNMVEKFINNPKYRPTKDEREVMAVYGTKIKEMATDEREQMDNEESLEVYKTTAWRTWQEELLQELQETPDNRKVIVYVDEKGNNGKSYLSKYLALTGAATFNTTKMTDVAYTLNGNKIVIFDLARHSQDQINWGAIEAVKNGLIFSGKYKSKTKVFKAPHVIVMMNTWPDESRLSSDRWDIRDLGARNDVDFI
ncbi:replication-associated protein [Delphin virus 1]|uniref:Replication-associated protein n=1 Tax=Delphin virus 1 TaxID=2817834 RepID=A0A8A3BDF9_9VIRU|nr:replication-associated protein [Delphin virus 1]